MTRDDTIASLAVNSWINRGRVMCPDAKLSGADLTDADLTGADLRWGRPVRGQDHSRQPHVHADRGDCTMSPEELDEARAKEAWRQGGIANPLSPERNAPLIAARLAREGWTPPEPEDPDVLAFREWETRSGCSDAYRKAVLAGKWDHSVNARAFLAGARMARERDAKMTAEEKLLRAIFGPAGRPAKEADQ